MKKAALLIIGIFVVVISFSLVACQKKEAPKAPESVTEPAGGLGEKAKEAVEGYGEKAEEAVQGYGEKAKEAVEGYGEKAEEAVQGYGEKAKEAVPEAPSYGAPGN